MWWVSPAMTVMLGALVAAMWMCSLRWGVSWWGGRGMEAMVPVLARVVRVWARWMVMWAASVEGEGAGGVGGGDFALGVADDGVGVDVVVLPDFG